MGSALFSFADPVVQAFLAAGAAILLDWICGVLVSLKPPVTFSVAKLWQQLWTAWLPMVGGLIVLAILAAVAERYPGFIQGTGYVTLVAGIVAVGAKALYDIFTKLQVLLGTTVAPPPSPPPG